MSLLLRLLIWWGLSSMSRRARGAAGAPPPWRTPGQTPSSPLPDAWLRRQQRLAHLSSGAAENARLAWRVVCLATFLAATSLLLTAGSTLAALGTRWLGVVMLVLAGFGLLLSILEGRMVVRGASARRQRRRAALIRAQRD